MPFLGVKVLAAAGLCAYPCGGMLTKVFSDAALAVNGYLADLSLRLADNPMMPDLGASSTMGYGDVMAGIAFLPILLGITNLLCGAYRIAMSEEPVRKPRADAVSAEAPTPVGHAPMPQA